MTTRGSRPTAAADAKLPGERILSVACPATTREAGWSHRLTVGLTLATSLAVGVLSGATDVRAHPVLSSAPETAELPSVDHHQGPTTAEHLRIGIWNTAGNVTTYTIGNSWNGWMPWRAFDKLREPSPCAGEAEPWLATSVAQISDDARSWEITLRDGVRWHDGTDFKAEDVAFTCAYYREGPANRRPHHASPVPRIEQIEVIDRLTLRITSQSRASPIAWR